MNELDKGINIKNEDYEKDGVRITTGKNGIQERELTGDIVLVVGTDNKYQHVYHSSSNFDYIDLSTVNANNGDEFYIANVSAGVGSSMDVRDGIGGTKLITLYSGSKGIFVFDGTNWVIWSIKPGVSAVLGKTQFTGFNGVAIGEDARANGTYSVAIGYDSFAPDNSIAIGANSEAGNSSIAIGINSDVANQSIGIGYQANVDGNSSIAIGYLADTQSFKYSKAIGFNSKATRHGEEVTNISNSIVNHYKLYGILSWSIDTSNDTPTELFLGGVADARATIQPNSTLSFDGIAVARNNVDNVSKSWRISGLIQRDNANNTTLIDLTVSIIGQSGVYDTSYDTNNWVLNITADDTNESLKQEGTGELTKTIRWASSLKFVEVRF